MKDLHQFLLDSLVKPCVVEVLYPGPAEAYMAAQNPPTCELGGVLVEIFGRWPSVN